MPIAFHPVAVTAAAELYQQPLAQLWRDVATRPADVTALCDLGNLLVRAKRPADAVSLLSHAVALAPHDPRLWSNLGIALCDAGELAAAGEAFTQAIARDPDWPTAHHNLGRLHLLQGDPLEAQQHFAAALRLDPSHLKAQQAMAQALLASGDLATGFAAYEPILHHPDVPGPKYERPKWQGEVLGGRTLLLTAEYGLGDAVQFIRYAALAKDRGARTIVRCPAPLVPLLAVVPGVDEVVDLEAAVPEHAFWIPLSELPRIFGTTLETIPATIPYLLPPEHRRAHWLQWRRDFPAGTRLVGIYWQGNPHHEWDQFRSCPLAAFAPLLELPGVQLVSLQRGPGTEQIADFQAVSNGRLIVPAMQDEDLGDFAALLHAMDRVVTIDTLTAHLAGAMGLGVDLLLAVAADWRWMTKRADSPWYPSLKLWRQRELGTWDAVMSDLQSALGSTA